MTNPPSSISTKLTLDKNCVYKAVPYSVNVLCDCVSGCCLGDRGDRGDDAGVSGPRGRRESLTVRPVHALSGPPRPETLRLQHQLRGP